MCTESRLLQSKVAQWIAQSWAQAETKCLPKVLSWAKMKNLLLLCRRLAASGKAEKDACLCAVDKLLLKLFLVLLLES